MRGLNKKIIALILTIIMLLTSCSTTIYAVTETLSSDENTEEVATVSDEEETVEETEATEEAALDDAEDDEEEETVTESYILTDEETGDTYLAVSSISEDDTDETTDEESDLATSSLSADEISGTFTFGSSSAYGHELHYVYINGVKTMLFCMQYGATSYSGAGTAGTTFTLSENTSYDYLAEMVFFGYTERYSEAFPTTTAAAQAACATQQWVWTYLGYSVSISGWSSTYLTSSIYSSWYSYTTTQYNEYHAAENPSFNGAVYTFKQNTVNYIEDTAGCMQYYDTFAIEVNGMTFTHYSGENGMYVTIPEGALASYFDSSTYGIYKNTPSGSSGSSSRTGNHVYFNFSGSYQDVFYSTYFPRILVYNYCFS